MPKFECIDVVMYLDDLILHVDSKQTSQRFRLSNSIAAGAFTKTCPFKTFSRKFKTLVLLDERQSLLSLSRQLRLENPIESRY